jgi:ABC-type uncharacterized transport system auxiliary subunit
MTMTGKIPAVCLVALALLTGCSSILFKTSKAPELYQAPYAPRVAPCPGRFSQGVRVWEFSAAAPFDRPDMVVREGTQQVLLSRASRWVSSPGAMVSEHLYQDLTQGSLFTEVATGATPRDPPLALSGRIFNFSWGKDGVGSRAELTVEATLSGERPGEQPLYFHKVYTLTGDRLAQNTPNAFAEGMGKLLTEFSQRLQSDLCTVAVSQGAPLLPR